MFLLISAPFRYLVRYEVTKVLNAQRMSEFYDKSDIRKAMQRSATASSARYVADKMRDAAALALGWQPLGLLTSALEKADIGNNNLICEFGVYTGTTINHLASLTNSTIYGFDSFEGLPERWRDGREKGTFRVSRRPDVFGKVVLVVGWIQES